MIADCPREADVLDALASRRWPHRVDRELAEHVASCAVCRDVIAVASALRADHDLAWREANVPSSGQMWWRAEMRARQDAIREASRPVTIAQGVAALLAFVVAVAAGWFAWPALHALFASLSNTGDTRTPTTALPMMIPIVVAMCALLVVVTPLALYAILSED